MKLMYWCIGIMMCMCANTAYSQVSVGYYPWNSLVSVSTNVSKPLWVDFRLQTNTLLGSLSTEVLPLYSFKQNERVQYYAGGGLRFNFISLMAGHTKNPIEGYMLNAGARISPFKSQPNIKLVFEFAPFVERKFDSGVLKTNFGLVYVLQKK